MFRSAAKQRAVELFDRKFQGSRVLFAGSKSFGVLGGDAEEIFQRGDNLLHARITILRLLGHHLQQNRREIGGDVLGESFGRRYRLRGMLGDDFHGAFTDEGRAASEQVVERAAEGIDIGAGINASGVLGLLGGHISWSPHGQRGAGGAGIAGCR